MEYIIRFLIGGLVVSVFSVIGDVIRPRNFSGIFAAAPTIALSTLALAFLKDSPSKISTEGRSMILGAAALLAYSLFTRYLMLKREVTGLPAAGLAYIVWFAVAFGLWAIFLR